MTACITPLGMRPREGLALVVAGAEN